MFGSSLSNTFQDIISFFANYLFIFLIMMIFIIIMQWLVFVKAGKPGWKSIIPVYNMVILYQIVGIKPLYLLLWFIPVVNFIAIPILSIVSMTHLAHSFSKSTAFGLGLAFLPFIFYPILVFSKSKYIGPNGEIRYEAPQPMSSDYSKPQNYKDKDSLNKPSVKPVISMGGGQAFHSAPITQAQDATLTPADLKDVTPKEESAPVPAPTTQEQAPTPVVVPASPTFVEPAPSAPAAINTPTPPEKATFIDNPDPFEEKEETISCSNCGATLAKDATVCFLCGQDV